MLHRDGQEAGGTFCLGALSRHVSGQSGKAIFKELKELHQDPALLSRGLGKLADELAANRSCLVLWKRTATAWGGKAAQKIEKEEKRRRETGTFYFSLPNGPRCSRSGACQEQPGFGRRHLLPRYQCYWGSETLV